MARRCYICRLDQHLNRFPSDEYYRSFWLKALNFDQNKDVSELFICVLHFLPSDVVAYGNMKILKIDAIPTVNVPNVVVLKKDVYVQTMESEYSPQKNSLGKILPSTIQHDFSRDIKSLKMNEIKRKKKENRSKMKLLRQRQRRILLRIKALKELVDFFENQQNSFEVEPSPKN